MFQATDTTQNHNWRVNQNRSGLCNKSTSLSKYRRVQTSAFHTTQTLSFVCQTENNAYDAAAISQSNYYYIKTQINTHCHNRGSSKMTSLSWLIRPRTLTLTPPISLLRPAAFRETSQSGGSSSRFWVNWTDLIYSYSLLIH